MNASRALTIPEIAMLEQQAIQGDVNAVWEIGRADGDVPLFSLLRLLCAPSCRIRGVAMFCLGKWAEKNRPLKEYLWEVVRHTEYPEVVYAFLVRLPREEEDAVGVADYLLHPNKMVRWAAITWLSEMAQKGFSCPRVAGEVASRIEGLLPLVPSLPRWLPKETQKVLEKIQPRVSAPECIVDREGFCLGPSA